MAILLYSDHTLLSTTFFKNGRLSSYFSCLYCKYLYRAYPEAIPSIVNAEQRKYCKGSMKSKALDSE